MTKKMSKAAQLYWADIDVLEEARLELVEFLDAVWEAWESNLDGAWSEVQTRWGEVEYYKWKENQPGRRGTWHVHVKDSASNFSITLMDPRRTERDARRIHLLLECNKSTQGKLRKRGDSAIKRITEVALGQDITLNWDAPNATWNDSVEVEPESADATGERLADLTREYLEHILRFDKVLGGHGDVPAARGTLEQPAPPA